MSQFWQSILAVGETATFTVDFTDEMDALNDTITGTPTVAFTAGTLYGLTATGPTLDSTAKKVSFILSNSDWATNANDVKTNQPWQLKITVVTTNGNTLIRYATVIVAESASDLSIESGSGDSGAESYQTLALADRYHAEHGNLSTGDTDLNWSGTDHERAQALRRGAQALDGRFAGRLKGYKKTDGQALQWPRSDVEDEDGYLITDTAVPQRVKDAQCEMARFVKATQDHTEAMRISKVSAGSGGAAVAEFGWDLKIRSLLDVVDELMWPYVLEQGMEVTGRAP